MKEYSLLLICTLSVMTAQASEITSFALEFSRDQIPLSDQSRLEVDGLGVRFSENNESSGLPLRLDLVLGREAVSHNNDSLSLGFQPDGYYAGITLGTASPRWHSFQIGADLGYSYHSATQQFNLQQLKIDWHRAEARGWLALHLNNVAKLYACAVAINIDGTQTINSNSPSRIGFSNQQGNGYCGGIVLEVGNEGYIGLEAESRHQRGGRLYFGKRYDF